MKNINIGDCFLTKIYGVDCECICVEKEERLASDVVTLFYLNFFGW